MLCNPQRQVGKNKNIYWGNLHTITYFLETILTTSLGLSENIIS